MGRWRNTMYFFRIILAHFICCFFFCQSHNKTDSQSVSQSAEKILLLSTTLRKERPEKKILLDGFQIISSALISIQPQLPGVEPWLFVASSISMRLRLFPRPGIFSISGRGQASITLMAAITQILVTRYSPSSLRS